MIARVARLVVFEWQKLAARRLSVLALLGVAGAAAVSPLAGRVIDAARALSAGKAAGLDEYQNGWTTLASGVRAGMFFATIVVLVFAGSSLAEETREGTLKTLLVRPLRRTELILAKWLALTIVAIVLLLVMIAAAGGVGAVRHGFHDIVNPDFPKVVVQTRAAMVGYTLRAVLMTLPSLTTLVAFALLFSAAIDHPGYAVGAAIVVYLVLGMTVALDPGAARALFPTYVGLPFEKLSDIAEQYNVGTKDFRALMPRVLLVPAMSTLAFLGGAAWLLRSRDIGD